jgi:hypothetical protein
LVILVFLLHLGIHLNKLSDFAGPVQSAGIAKSGVAETQRWESVTQSQFRPTAAIESTHRRCIAASPNRSLVRNAAFFRDE